MSGDDARDALARQVERGSLFTHAQLSELAERVNDVEPLLYGLIDALVARGLIAEDDVLDAGEAARAEMQEHGEALTPGLAVRVDDGPPVVAEVDCARRLPVCRAVCCKLSFALTIAEIEAGRIKFDLGQPYHIRHEADGHCSHLARPAGTCAIYADRPGGCRSYACAGDARIWTDYDAMVLNHAWLDEHLADDRVRFASDATRMHAPDELLKKVRPPR